MSDVSTQSAQPSPAPSTLIAPTKQKDRITTLDALRGFALLGVLITNMLQGYSFVNTRADEVVATLIRAFAEGSFFPMFSFLFGLGFALQLRKGEAALPRFRRRLAILLGIGLVHLLLVWSGDILFTYAVLGFILILFRNTKDRTLLTSAFFMWLFTVLVLVLLASDDLIPGVKPGEGVAPAGDTYLSALAGRLGNFPNDLINLLFIGWDVLALFLVGYFVGRKGVRDVLENKRFLRRILVTCVLLAAPFTLWLLGFIPTFQGASWMYGLEYLFAGPLIAFAYLAGLSLFRDSLEGFLKPFVPVGQMALSNYLGQSVICTTLFYPYAFNLWGLGIAATLPIALAIFAFQILFSRWWLRHYRFGPAEWVWRSLTYGQLQPLRRGGAAQATP